MISIDSECEKGEHHTLVLNLTFVDIFSVL